MKKILLFALIALTFGFAGCSKDEDNNTSTEHKYIPVCSDEVVGVGQAIILSVDYQSNNPNILVTWFCNGEKTSPIPRDLRVYDYSFGEIGEYELYAIITDGSTIIETEKIKIAVIECDLGRGILGDNKEKILRIAGEYFDGLDMFEDNWGYQYFFDKQGVLTRIYYVAEWRQTINNKSQYAIPISRYESLLKQYTTRYGDPIINTIAGVINSDDDRILYGSKVLSKSVYFYATFEKGDILAEISIKPNSKANYYNLTQDVWLK